MRLSNGFILAATAVTLVALGLGCGGDALQPPNFDAAWQNVKKPFARAQSPEDADDSLTTTVETPLIGEHTTIAGLNLVPLEGVGLVVGLDGTGSDPPPSRFRETILNEMKRRGVKNPNQLLASPNTAVVVVRAYLPPLVKKGDRFDVDVRVPGESETKSLNGGWLLETYLVEQALVEGRGLIEGHEYAKATGPILVSSSEADTVDNAGQLRRGNVLGGGYSTTERNLTLFLRSDFASFRNAKRVASRIGKRFYRYNLHGLHEPLADAKTPQRIELDIEKRYKENYPRYLQVIRNIAFRESSVAQRVRIEQLAQKLNDPPQAERASLQLEAIGDPAVPVLREALDNKSLEVRFHASMALAYLGEADGVPHLAEAAKKEPAFRAFAFAGLAAVEDASAHIALRDLMSGESGETRYGAFRSLSVLDKNDPFIRGEKMNDQFMLHVLRTSGEPMVHLTNRKKAEVVLFGADQMLSTPIAIRAGKHILITANSGSEKVTVSRYQVGSRDQKKQVSRRIEEIIRAASDLGASFPDIAQMLVQADFQKNLPGRFEIDALPKSGRVYYRPDPKDSERKTRARVGRGGLNPNLFSIEANAKPEAEEEPETEEAPETPVPANRDALLKDNRKWYDITRIFQPAPFSGKDLEEDTEE